MARPTPKRILIYATTVFAVLLIGTWTWLHFSRGPIHLGNVQALVEAINNKSGVMTEAEVEALLGGPAQNTYKHLRIRSDNESGLKIWANEDDGIWIDVYFDEQGLVSHANYMSRITGSERWIRWLRNAVGLD